MPVVPVLGLDSGLDSALSCSVPQGQLRNVEHPSLGALFHCSPFLMVSAACS